MRSKWLRLLAALLAFALIAAACGDDDDDDGTTTEQTDETEGEDTEGEDAEGEDTEGEDEEDMEEGEEGEDEEGMEEGDGEEEAPAGDIAMTVAFDINPDAVWSDGTPITVADFECTHAAIVNTPTSITTSGYDQMVSVTGSDKSVELNFGTVYAPFRDLFNYLLPAHLVADCNDVSGDFLDEIPVSGRGYQIESWSTDQLVLVPNESYWGDKTPNVERVVMVPRPENQIEALAAGEVDMIFPQAFAGIADALDDPNITNVPGYGTFYEGLYFQQLDGPFADPIFREAFSKSVDRAKILENIYDPIFPGGQLLGCGLWVPTIGDWCDQTQFDDAYDPEGAATLLTDAGWTQNGDGMWQDGNGDVPEIRWMINEPNPRRQDTQALMIPEFQAAGFNVVTDNGDAATVFQQRLPALDYDLAMYINVASPDPSVTSIMSCEQVPTEENDFQGQNSVGWCNEEASAIMNESDKNVDVASRVDQIHQIGEFVASDFVMLPLYQFPNIAAWRTDKLAGDAPGLQAANYRSFSDNIWEWEDADGDGEIIIGAEQWPDCINPVTECANSSWMVWTATFPVLPAMYDTTGEGTYALTDLIVAEPEVIVNEG